jgi:hypothetical protein
LRTAARFWTAPAERSGDGAFEREFSTEGNKGNEATSLRSLRLLLFQSEGKAVSRFACLACHRTPKRFALLLRQTQFFRLCGAPKRRFGATAASLDSFSLRG